MTEQKQVIPEGYKQTEVGVIPEDWDIQRLGVHATFKTGPFGSALHKSDYVDGGIPVVNPMQIIDGKVKPTSSMAISDEAAKKLSEYRLIAGDIVIGRRGDMGRCAVISEIENGWLCGTGSMIVRVKENADAAFLQRVLSNPQTITAIESASVGTTMINLNQGTLRALLILIPRDKQEQTAIANALSDVDALINELEKLIAKKQAIKTATMQQLLTGKTRLPQFALREDGTPKGYKASELGEIPEDWEVVSLAEIGQTIIGLTYSPNDVAEHGTLVLRSSNVQNNVLAYDNNVYVNMDLPERVIVKKGDILICVRNGSRQLIGKCALIDKNADGAAFGAFMSIFRTKSFGFVFYQFQSDIIQNQINEIMGATINQITNKDMAGFRIPLPTLQKEQVAITSILSDMDTEIQSLQQRLTKTRQIKQGMMQELLTGKTRLVKPEGSVHA